MDSSSGPQRLTDSTLYSLHAVITDVTISGADSVYTTRASSSAACLTILYASDGSSRNRNMYRFVGMARFSSSSNCPSAARHVLAADSPVESERTKIGFGSTSLEPGTVGVVGAPRDKVELELSSSSSFAVDAVDAVDAAASRKGSCSATVLVSTAAVDVTGFFRRLDACESRDLRCFRRRLKLELARARMASAARALASFGSFDSTPVVCDVTEVATAIFAAPAPAAVVDGDDESPCISFIVASIAFLSAPFPPSSPAVSSFLFVASSSASFSSLATRSLRSRSFASRAALALTSSCCACLTRSLARSTLSSMANVSSLTGAASPVTLS
mmetsp:Transcript_8537/g.38796  ORF Transcript_8537/g.38796 Transcript_8537/m.38796 type:complete len:330 (-) Transcript_8537:520-1509(-)